MNHENNQEINLRQFLSLRAFKELLKNPPDEFSNRIGEEVFFGIANFLSNIPPEDQLNPMAMFQHISSYVYQPGHEVFKEFYLQTYKTINSEHIQYVVKKTGDPGNEADGPSIAQEMLDNDGRDACRDMQTWSTEMQKDNPPKTEDDN